MQNRQNRLVLNVSRVSEFEMHGVQHSVNGRITVLGFTICGKLALPTRGFWQALFTQFRAATDEQTVDEAEFFIRLRRSLPDAHIRYAIDWDEDGNALLCDPQQAISRTNPCRHGSSNAGSNHQNAVFMEAAPGTLRFSLN